MRNKLPQKKSRLFSSAEDNAAGCHAHEVAINLKQNKEADMIASLTPARAAETLFQQAKALKVDATKARQLADKAARELIQASRNVLEPKLGVQWSQSWAGAGFVDGSLAMPRTLAERIALLLSLKGHFTTYPAHESDQMGVTATALADAHTALQAANVAANASVVDLALKKVARNSAVKGLRKRMGGLITELKQLLPPDDPRWHAFGLNRPAAVGLPEVPEGLLVLIGGPGHLLAKWDAAPLGERYRVYRKIMGVDSDFVLVKTTTETEADVNSMVTGQVVKVRVSAVNEAGESTLSEPVEQTVP
jgi:hypothetical protein